MLVYDKIMSSQINKKIDGQRLAKFNGSQEQIDVYGPSSLYRHCLYFKSRFFWAGIALIPPLCDSLHAHTAVKPLYRLANITVTAAVAA